MQLLSTVALLAAITVNVVAQDLNIQTPPQAVQCQPTLLQFTGPNPPFFITVVPQGQIGAPPLADLGTSAGPSGTWVVNLASGTACTLIVKNQLGATAFSGPFSVGASSDSGCVGKPTTLNGGGSSSSGGSSSTAASSSSGAPPPTSSSAATTAASSSAGTTAASSPSGTSPASTPKPSSTASSGSSGASTSSSSSPANTSNAALILNSGPAAGIIGFLLAAVIA